MAALTNHNVVGTFPDLKAARDIMRRLNEAGIDAEEISLLGKAAEEVTSDPDTRLRDLESTGDLGRSAAKTASLGSVLGGIAGAVALVLPGIGPVVGAGIWAAAGGGAIAGGVLGGMVGAIGATELGPDWEVTYGAALQEGRALVAVHARDEDEVAKAVKVFEKDNAERVDHLDESGKPLPEERA
jgi:outer membrane lipoprotein SlyB